MKINDFRGDVPDSLAKKEALQQALHAGMAQRIARTSVSASVFKIKSNVLLDTLIQKTFS